MTTPDDEYEAKAREIVDDMLYSEDSGPALIEAFAAALRQIGYQRDVFLKRTETLTESYVDSVKSIAKLNNERDSLKEKLGIAIECLELVAAPKRNDGTYNRCREACEVLAAEALAKIKEGM